MGIRNSIDGALPALLAGYNQLQARAASMGIQFEIADFGGIRTEADTILILSYRAADYAAAVIQDPSVYSIPINTWRPIAPFGSSMHNYGAAFDVKITATPAGLSSADALQQLKMLAPACGLQSTVPNDPPHFELPISLDDAKTQWSALGNSTPSITVLTSSNVAAASTVAVIVGLVALLAYFRRRG